LNELLRDINPGTKASDYRLRPPSSLGSKAGSKIAATLLSEASGTKLGIMPTPKVIPAFNESQLHQGTPEAQALMTTLDEDADTNDGGCYSRPKGGLRASVPCVKERALLLTGDPFFGLCEECSLFTEVLALFSSLAPSVCADAPFPSKEAPWCGEYKHERTTEKIHFDVKNLDELVAKMLDKHSGIPLRKKKSGLLKLTTLLYFSGADLVDWLLKRYTIFLRALPPSS